ncbi:type II toxin-antitoxin system Phd/YefM family antitoxin [Aquabacter spiritensis]|uniref:Antitoxin n=1 Tax=Aquabacter spiritensis TaxID=933073 RepID=A0A4R3M5V3_9HYPH|nr:type II toxin-antitoxin system prevent-host-death family antitoxin [Aquabacter spiritensis]TCT07639.1 prevent-host-death family protein [Aquabacter spiritensis]
MDTIGLAQARARLGAVIARVAAGAAIVITRRGKPVARLSGIAGARRPVDAARLQALTATLPPQVEGAADLVRAMRDGDRF